MTTRDQFEDASEDAESDHPSLKIIGPKDSALQSNALQSNGHVVQGTEPEDINGRDLPESESADYQTGYPGEHNGEYEEEDEYHDELLGEGGLYDGDRLKDVGYLEEEDSVHGIARDLEGDNKINDEQTDQYQESKQYRGEDLEEPDQYKEVDDLVEGHHQYSGQGEEGKPSESGGQYKEEDQYSDQYSDQYNQDEYGENDGYTEEDQYYDEGSQQYSEDGKRELQDTEAQQGGLVDHTSTENTPHEVYDGHGEENDTYEYTEDDAYNHANYANDGGEEDSPPEDKSESDQFIDNPDIDEFRPAAIPFGFPTAQLMDPMDDERQYEFHDPEMKEQDGVYEDSGIVSGENSTTDLGNTAHHSDVELDISGCPEVEKDSPLPEEDSKEVHEVLYEPPRLEEIESLARSKDGVKVESDSTEADQQREEMKTKTEPERPAAPTASKIVVEGKPRPENSMQYKESKELESILHSNLNALTSKKVKVEEVVEPGPKPEPEDGITETTNKPSSQAIPTQGSPRRVKSPQQGTKPGPPHQSRAPGGPRRQAGPRPARGKAPTGSRSAPRAPRGESGGTPQMNQGKRPDRVIRGERSDPSSGRRGPGSAKPASVLKSMVQNARQEVQDLDSMLVASTENSADEREKGMRSPERVSRPDQKGLRHSMEYAAAADVLQGRGPGLPEEPRNNSNGNHLRRPNNRKKPKRPQSAYFPSAYSRNIEESLVSTPGEVVFDDIAECNAYLREKEHSMGQRLKSDNGPRRRRNSYELANRESSEEENNDPYNSYFPSSDLIPGHHARSNHEVFARLEDDYGADDSGNADDLPDSTQPSVTSDVSTPSTPGSQSNNGDQRPKLPLGINPLDYDVVGLRLAEPLDDSSLSINSIPAAEPVPDQFSDADEDDDVEGASCPGAVSSREVMGEINPVHQSSRPLEQGVPWQPSQSSPRKPRQEVTREVTRSPKSLPPQRSPPRQVDIGKTMEELKSISETSKSAMSKVPTFYVPEDNKSSPWVLQPGLAIEQDKQDRMRRHKLEMQRREQEYQQIQRRQREELHQKQDPHLHTYIRRDEDETEVDTDSESRNLMDSDQPQPQTHQQKQTSSADMRAPDLPPTTGKIKEARGPHDEKDLKNGIRYQAAYLGSTQLITTKQPTRKVRMQQAQEAVNRIKAPEGEEQPNKEVDLAISNERIQVLNADSQETMMDHPLKTISYIADIGNIVVIMARRRSVKTLDEAVEESGVSVDGEGKRQPRKIICHVFETEDAQLIAQTIGQAFALAYLEFLKVNGIDDAHVHEMDYHDVLNSQEIYGDDLMLFSNKECEKEALVEKVRGEIMGMVIVESGWGSLIPTVVVANMSPFGAAARSGKLNIGDQIMAINGTSLVGLPLHECQNVIKSLKSQALVKFNIVSCPPVTQVLIKRPDTKYQLGFSVQNGIICSLMRGGIAERGGVRVGHRIIEINGTSVVATPHEKIVDLLSTSVGEIRMKTMPLSMYKLLTGQEQPLYI